MKALEIEYMALAGIVLFSFITLLSWVFYYLILDEEYPLMKKILYWTGATSAILALLISILNFINQ